MRLDAEGLCQAANVADEFCPLVRNQPGVQPAVRLRTRTPVEHDATTPRFDEQPRWSIPGRFHSANSQKRQADFTISLRHRISGSPEAAKELKATFPGELSWDCRFHHIRSHRSRPSLLDERNDIPPTPYPNRLQSG
jgi:hypothetical protein